MMPAGETGGETELRVSVAASQLIGLALARHVVRIESLASASPETLGVLSGPARQHCLTGDLTRPPDRPRPRGKAVPHRPGA